MNNWTEELPKNCPPADAFDPNGMVFYRLAKTNPVTENDFLSQRAIKPKTVFENVNECISRSLSVWDDFEKCINIFKLPRHKNKPQIVMKLNLKSGDGLILHTFKPNHFSWWRTKNYDISSTLVIPL